MSEVVTLEALRRMLQRVLDAQDIARAEARHVRRELTRIDRMLSALQRADLDRIDAQSDIDERLESLSRRLERLEDGP